jgi:hypothetical protein
MLLDGAMAREEQSISGATAVGRFAFYLKELLNSGGMADIWLVTDAGRRLRCAGC